MACYINRRDHFRALDQTASVLLAAHLMLGVSEVGRRHNGVLVITDNPGHYDLGRLGYPLRRTPDDFMGYSGRV